MNILVLGNKGYGVRSHFEENLAITLSKMKHNVHFIGCEDIKEFITEKRFELHRYKKMPFKLSRFAPDEEPFDFVFIAQSDFEWLNDIKIPVFYYTKYVHRRFGTYYPTVSFFITQAVLDYCAIVFAPYEIYISNYNYIMPSCTETDTYKPAKKEYEGISWFGSRNAQEEKIDHVELLGIAQRTLYRWEEDILRDIASKAKDVQFNLFETPVPTEKYRELLPKCESMFMSIPRGQFTSRMLLEAMACKTICVFEVQSERHEKTLESLGLYRGKHYIGFDKLIDIEKIYHETENKEEIRENAYKVVTNNHLIENRAEFILDIYNTLYGDRK